MRYGMINVLCLHCATRRGTLLHVNIATSCTQTLRCTVLCTALWNTYYDYMFVMCEWCTMYEDVQGVVYCSKCLRVSVLCMCAAAKHDNT